MTSITVTSVAGLEAALKADTSGETIYLAPGTYSGVSVNSLNATHATFIESLDPTNQATISGLSVSNSNNIEFTNLNISSPLGTNSSPNLVSHSSQVVFNQDAFSGSTAATPANNNNGLAVTNSTNVHIDDSTFTQLQNGIFNESNNGITIYNNKFTGLGGDGIDNQGSSNVVISSNNFTNFQEGNGIHPDAIQFWTTNTTASVSNITIEDNVINRGTGTLLQGIFMTDQVGDLSYNNVSIVNNTLVGTQYNGIELDHGVNSTISGNTVIGYTSMQSWILAYDNTNLTLANNQTQYFVMQSQAQAQLHASGDEVPLTITSTDQTFATDIAGLAASTAVSGVSVSLVGTTEQSLVLTGAGDLTATANNLGDRIIANSGADTLYGGTGGDTFTEGAGRDTFVLSLNTGKDVITNFAANGLHDAIDLSAYLNAGLHPTMAAVGDNTVITLDSHGDTLTLLGVNPSALHWTSTGLMH